MSVPKTTRTEAPCHERAPGGDRSFPRCAGLEDRRRAPARTRSRLARRGSVPGAVALVELLGVARLEEQRARTSRRATRAGSTSSQRSAACRSRCRPVACHPSRSTSSELDREDELLPGVAVGLPPAELAPSGGRRRRWASTASSSLRRRSAFEASAKPASVAPSAMRTMIVVRLTAAMLAHTGRASRPPDGR